jgi:hypothetical protein
VGQQGHQRHLIASGGLHQLPIPCYNYQVNHRHPMSTDAIIIEHLNAGEIFDFEEKELFESEDDENQTFEAFLNSNWDF